MTSSLTPGGVAGKLSLPPPTSHMATPEFLDPRLTERRNPRTTAIDVASSLEIFDLLNAEDETVAVAVRRGRGANAEGDALGGGGGWRGGRGHLHRAGGTRRRGRA